MRILLFLISIILLCNISFAQDDSSIFAFTETGKKIILRNDGTWEFIEVETTNFDIRNVRWGMSREEVIQSEEETIYQETENYIAYSTELASLDVFLVYHFIDDMLVRANYLIIEEHSNEYDYISDFNILLELLIIKYGETEHEDEYRVWKNNLLRDSPNLWGTALSTGDLVYEAIWNLERTEIILNLSGEHYDISLIIQYSSKGFSEFEERKALGDL